MTLKVGDLEWQDESSLRVLIARSQTDRSGEGRFAFTSPGTAATERDWLDLRETEIGWLFCSVYHGKSIDSRLSVDTVKRVVKSSARRAGFTERTYAPSAATRCALARRRVCY